MGWLYRGLLCLALLLAGHRVAFSQAQPESEIVDQLHNQEPVQETGPFSSAGDEEDPELVDEWDERARHPSSDLASFWS